MTSVEELLLKEVAEIKEQLAAINRKLDALAGMSSSSPATTSDYHSRLMALAKVNPRASIEEAKRISRADSIRRREEKKAAKK